MNKIINSILKLTPWMALSNFSYSHINGDSWAELDSPKLETVFFLPGYTLVTKKSAEAVGRYFSNHNSSWLLCNDDYSEEL